MRVAVVTGAGSGIGRRVWPGARPNLMARFESSPRSTFVHVADTVAYMAGLPADANALFVTVMAAEMPFVGRG